MTFSTSRPGSWWTRRSIRHKLAIPFAIVIGAISLFVYLYFPSTMERREMETLESRGQSLAAVAAFGVRAAVVFEDRAFMERSLRGLVQNGDVVYAQLRRPDGEVLVDVVSDALQDGHEEGTGGPSMTRVVLPVVHEADTIAEVVLMLSRADLRNHVAEMRTMVQIVAAVIFLVGVLALIVLSGLVTRPLFAIFEAAELISAGDLSRRVTVQTQDEVGQLSQSFNTMIDQLETTQDELKDMNRSLEERVEERTERWLEEQSQRMRAEEEMQELEAFFGEIMDAIPLEVTVHALDRSFLYVNPAAEPSAARREQMIGRTPGDVGEADRVGVSVFERRQEAVARAIRTSCLVSIEEHVKDGGDEGRYFLRVYSPMLTEDGEVTKVVGYGVDITNRREAEEALRESEEQLRQSQKMEAVGRLAGGIAHDFNNLLTVITGHTQLLLSGTEEGDPDRNDLTQVGKAADRAATLTRQLLAFSRKQVLRPTRLSPNEAIGGVHTMLARLIGEHIDLVTSLDPTVGDVRADPGQFEQVLMNLAVNSRDAMPEGGRLIIETSESTAQEAEAQFGYELADGDYVVTSVRDTGIGIPLHLQGKIFEPFFTTKSVGKGTGLGLSTVYGIVSQSDGHVFVDSKAGVGTIFRVFLPRLGAVDGAGETTAIEVRRPVGGTETILLVEDEPMVRDLTRTILLRAGYNVLTASGPHEAIGVAGNHRGAIDLLFTDVVMPGMPGHELAARVLEIRESVKVLYMSGYTDDALLDHGVLADGVVLIQKPFSAERVIQVTRAVLDGDQEEVLALQE